MARSIHIVFDAKARSFDVWRFAEDISRALDKNGLGSLPMDEADATKDRVCIHAIKAKKLKRAIAFIEHELRDWGLRDYASLTVTAD